MNDEQVRASVLQPHFIAPMALARLGEVNPTHLCDILYNTSYTIPTGYVDTSIYWLLTGGR